MVKPHHGFTGFGFCAKYRAKIQSGGMALMFHSMCPDVSFHVSAVIKPVAAFLTKCFNH
jgi:hypothetical protein